MRTWCSNYVEITLRVKERLGLLEEIQSLCIDSDDCLYDESAEETFLSKLLPLPIAKKAHSAIEIKKLKLDKWGVEWDIQPFKCGYYPTSVSFYFDSVNTPPFEFYKWLESQDMGVRAWFFNASTVYAGRFENNSSIVYPSPFSDYFWDYDINGQELEKIFMCTQLLQIKTTN